MTYTKTIVCLANSWKFGRGTCVAGREFGRNKFGDWIRPVSARPKQEISPLERQCQDGREVKVLDIVSIELAQPQPQSHQQENHVIAADRPWVRKGTVSWAQLQAAVEDPAGPLWINDFSSSNGENDEVPEHLAKSLPRSLYLVRPKGLVVTAAMEPGFNGAPPKRRLRARFRLCGIDYRIAVTDPVMSNELPDGDTKFPDTLLCVSLGEFLRGYAYKLAAAVITQQRAGS